jgi:chitinase
LGLFGQFNKLVNATKNGLHLTLSIGGWTWSKNFSLAVRTEGSRGSLADSIISLFQQWPCFHGVSIDWEYLSNNGVNYGNDGNIVHPDDSENLAKFIELLRHKFNHEGWHRHTIAMCCTPAPEKMHFDVKRLIALLDEWHIMTYEYSPFSSSLI